MLSRDVHPALSAALFIALALLAGALALAGCSSDAPPSAPEEAPAMLAATVRLTSQGGATTQRTYWGSVETLRYADREFALDTVAEQSGAARLSLRIAAPYAGATPVSMPVGPGRPGWVYYLDAVDGPFPPASGGQITLRGIRDGLLTGEFNAQFPANGWWQSSATVNGWFRVKVDGR